MSLKVFSKRHPKSARDIYLPMAVRNRIWYTIEESDCYYNPDGFNDNWTLCWGALPDRLKKEHGWQELRAYASQSKYETLSNSREFILRGIARFVLDAIEMFYDLLTEDRRRNHTSADPAAYQSKLNVIFEDANLPWRMTEGRIIRVDSKWLEEEIHSKANELLSISGFEGALAEFQQARSDLSSGDLKGAIHAANLSMESTIKGILGVEQAKPGVLIRKLIDSGLVPDYHEGFLKAFEEHILRSVPSTRNLERGVGHGQGTDISEPPKSLAELAVNLSGVLILFLLKRHLEAHPISTIQEEGYQEEDDDIPL